jgi:hypothetical protein
MEAKIAEGGGTKNTTDRQQSYLTFVYIDVGTINPLLMNLNSLLHIPKMNLNANRITGSFATILFSYLKENGIEVVGLKKSGKDADIVTLKMPDGKFKTVKFVGGSAYSFGKKIGLKNK